MPIKWYTGGDPHPNRKSAGDGNSLPCPVCSSIRHRVFDSRHHKHTIRRRRFCLTCQFNFYTCEIICDVDCNPVEKEPLE